MFKNLFGGGLDKNATWSDPFGRMPKYVIQLKRCDICGLDKPSDQLDDYGTCAACRRAEKALVERLIERHEFTNKSIVDDIMKSYK